MTTAPRVVILTVSDRCSRGETMDTSGPTLQALAVQHLGATIAHAECLPDDMEGHFRAAAIRPKHVKRAGA